LEKLHSLHQDSVDIFTIVKMELKKKSTGFSEVGQGFALPPKID
jgi:hypothetical protein